MNKKCPYINRDDVAQMLIEGVLENNSSPQYAEYIRMLVYSVPSADVVPVRHGRWIDRCEDTDGIYEFCSECGIDADITHYGKSYAYCPNCGAKMDGGEE